MAEEDSASREAVEALEAYAVYKMADYDEAYRRFDILANKGNVQGMLNTANMLLAGQGVKADAGKALHWYRKAAESGSSTGMYYTARALESGQGATVDLPKAMHWYEQAANAGSADAQQALFRLLINQGKKEQALHWLQQAADSGDPSAARLLAEFNATDSEPGVLPSYVSIVIKNALAAADRAASAGNASGVVYYLAHDANVLVRMAKLAEPLYLNKQGLQALWQDSFDRADHYTFTRRDTAIEEHSDQGYRVESVIDETLFMMGGQQRYRLHETLQLRVVENQIVVDEVRLTIETEDSAQ